MSWRLTASEHAQRIEWSVKTWNRMLLVTATLAEAEQDPRVISSRWTEFVRDLRRAIPGLRVVRVLQKHPGGHGWHIHALFDRYVSADVILHQAKLAGLGRIDFRMVSRDTRQNAVRYLARYVARDLRERDRSCKGVRMVTAAGNLNCASPWWVRICDIVIKSTYAEVRRSLVSVLRFRGFAVASWTDLRELIGLAPPEALADWRNLNRGLVY